eukprot:scaffold98242_cov54-Attheya_sp.AAC.2
MCPCFALRIEYATGTGSLLYQQVVATNYLLFAGATKDILGATSKEWGAHQPPPVSDPRRPSESTTSLQLHDS